MDRAVTGDRYEIIEYLGCGGVSEVYHARDLLNDREVALKILHPHLTDAADRMKQEIDITRRIDHPRIARYYELTETPDRSFLSLEYLPGGDLKRLILEHGALVALEAVRIGIETLAGLEAAHEGGVIHCDIKPHNILLDAEGHVRITDFGLARTGARTNPAEKSRAGTPDYVAPEVTTVGYFDARSDLYSLGVTLFEALTGVLPFQANSVEATLWKHANADIPSVRDARPDTPEALDAIIRKALAKDPAERFQTAKAFREALQSMSLPAATTAPESHRCPVCGNRILDAFPECLSCGHVDVSLARARRGEAAYLVAITGPGKPGDRLDPELRHRVLRFLESAGATSAAMQKSIPRIPFVLLRGLSRASALDAKSALLAVGIEAEVSGIEESAGRRNVSKLLNRKAVTLMPRVMLIAFGSMAGVFPTVGQNAPGLIVALLGMMVLGIPLTIRIGGGRAKATVTGGADLPFTAVLVPEARGLAEPAVKRLIAGICGKLHALDRTVGEDDALSEQDRQEILSSIRGLVEPLRELIREISELHRTLASLDEAGVYAQIRAGGDRTQSDTHGSSDVPTVRRNIEKTLQLYIDRILKCSAQLDQMSIRLAAIEGGTAREALGRIADVSRTLEIQFEAEAETQRLLDASAEGARR